LSAAPRIDVLTLFPAFIQQAAEVGVVGRAMRRGLFDVVPWQVRDFAEPPHRAVDDRPYGGGPGMVMLIDPLLAGLQRARDADPREAWVVYLSPQGSPLTQAKVRELGGRSRLILVCGRYEGVDQRFVDACIDEEISIGDYVLSGGELAAAVLIDALGRLQDGALNDPASADQDSFENGALDCPHYTRPPEHPLGSVPAVLGSGDHAAIRTWRRRESLGRTWRLRPDLLCRMQLSDSDRRLLDGYRADWLRSRIVPMAGIPGRAGEAVLNMG